MNPTYYFGFIPSDTLKTQIQQAKNLIDTQDNTPYYPLRDQITRQIAHELIDTLLAELVAVIPNPERKNILQKMTQSIQNTTENLIGHLLSKDDNAQVLQSFLFLQQSLFIDTQGVQRVGFKMDDQRAKRILSIFDNADQQGEISKLQAEELASALDMITHDNLQHFLIDFSQTLNLGLIKRKAIPLAQMAIDKGVGVTVHRLLPQLSSEGRLRLIAHFRQFFVVID